MPQEFEILALNKNARRQSSTGPAMQEMVTVAVLPPRLPRGLAPANGIGAAGAFDYDENLNWRHNEALPKDGTEKAGIVKNLRRKGGITGYRRKRHEDMPPFRMRTVPYDVWRKHYAKDKDGNYKGTHAPAEDCLLKHEDVAKWSGSAPETYADTWTRGKTTLPGYGDVNEEGATPEYVDTTAEGEAVGESKFFVERSVSDASQLDPQGISGRTIDGKTTAQVIAEAKAREAAKPKSGWKKMLSSGTKTALLGN